MEPLLRSVTSKRINNAGILLFDLLCVTRQRSSAALAPAACTPYRVGRVLDQRQGTCLDAASLDQRSALTFTLPRQLPTRPLHLILSGRFCFPWLRDVDTWNDLLSACCKLDFTVTHILFLCDDPK